MGDSVNPYELFLTEWTKGWDDAVQAFRSTLTAPDIQRDIQIIIAKHSRVAHLLHEDTYECKVCKAGVASKEEHVTDEITKYLLGLAI